MLPSGAIHVSSSAPSHCMAEESLFSSLSHLLTVFSPLLLAFCTMTYPVLPCSCTSFTKPLCYGFSCTALYCTTTTSAHHSCMHITMLWLQHPMSGPSGD